MLLSRFQSLVVNIVENAGMRFLQSGLLFRFKGIADPGEGPKQAFYPGYTLAQERNPFFNLGDPLIKVIDSITQALIELRYPGIETAPDKEQDPDYDNIAYNICGFHDHPLS